MKTGSFAGILAVCLALAACGSSSTTITSPGSVSKCAVTLEAPASTLPATGGTGSVALKTSRECEWNASSQAGWLTIVGGASGQGEGTIRYNVAANGDPVQRTGAIVANEQRIEVSQAAGACRLELASASASFSKAGGSGTVQVRASSALCQWTAASQADWISIRSGSGGKGTAAVAYDVAATTGPPRTGAMTIAGQRFMVTQSEGCTFAIAPTTHVADADGGSGSIGVTAGPGCPWTAASNVDWVSVTAGAAGSGNGTVQFTVAPSTGPTRTGTLNVAGETFTVAQSVGCTYAITPESQSLAASGGTGSANVAAASGCAWTATSNAEWITITSGASGSGAGTVAYSVAATTGPSRSGTLTIAGHTLTVNQGQGCSYSLSSSTAKVAATASSGSFDVATADGCVWSASSNAGAWITITSGASGSGAGRVAYSVAANQGPLRNGTITAGGRTFSIEQASGCTYGIAPTSRDLGNIGETVTVTVTAGALCSWIAQSHASWIGVSPGSGTGSGSVQLAVFDNTAEPRTGSATIAGQTFTVTQAGCPATLTPGDQLIPPVGAHGAFTVNTGATCPWIATPSGSWIRITAGGNGTGTGMVNFTVDPNTGGAREGTIGVLGQNFIVRQEAACSYAVAPETVAAAAAGGTVDVTVTTAAGCTWTSVSNNPDWIAVLSGAAGTGSAVVQLGMQPNAGVARAGTATIAGRTVTITQDAGCTFTIAPESADFTKEGGPGTVTLTTTDGCPWTAASTVPWITVTAGASGSGSGAVQYAVAPNPDASTRHGTLTVAGRTLAVKQDGTVGSEP